MTVCFCTDVLMMHYIELLTVFLKICNIYLPLDQKKKNLASLPGKKPTDYYSIHGNCMNN